MVWIARSLLLLNGTQSEAYHTVYYQPSTTVTDCLCSIAFKPVPSDYAILHMHIIPPAGGDTLWASTYDVYDRLGEKYAEFLEGLTGHYETRAFQVAADANGFKLYQGQRGSPENSNQVLEAHHPS